jgi:hypothetical protein
MANSNFQGIVVTVELNERKPSFDPQMREMFQKSFERGEEIGTVPLLDRSDIYASSSLAFEPVRQFRASVPEVLKLFKTSSRA